MVFFTCNHCGDSVKKPAVEKHYNMKCRMPVFMSCMDCNNDFREDYVKHTKCISEAEKYSGKDYVQKESKNTGQKKQESWLEIVRSILDTKDYEVSPAVRSILQKLQTYDNIPRKKVKCENFLKNCMRVSKHEVEAVWNVLEKAFGDFKATKKTGEKNSAVNSKENESQELKEMNESENQGNENINANSKGKKANKKKHLEQNTGEQPSEENQDEPQKKKKKKSKVAVENSLERNDADAITTNGEQQNGESVPVVGKKSKKKAIENGLEQSDAIPITNGEQQNGESVPVVGKKSKKKAIENELEQNDAIAITTNVVQQQNSEPMPVVGKKSKKKAQKEENNDTTITTTILGEDTEMNENADEITTQNREKPVVANDFDWNKVIFQILSKNNDEVSLGKLKTKVLKKYKARYQVTEIPWKVEKTFNKRLRKSGLVVENEIVKVSAK